MLEDFDHRYRHANLYELLHSRHADEITEHLTEITPGRPTIVERRQPEDDVRRHHETHAGDPRSRLHVLTSWELHRDMEIGQLQVACDFMRRLGGP